MKEMPPSKWAPEDAQEIRCPCCGHFLESVVNAILDGRTITYRRCEHCKGYLVITIVNGGYPDVRKVS